MAFFFLIEKNLKIFWEVVLFLHSVGPGDGTQVVGLGDKCLRLS